jgi:hypothetical protein
VVFGGDLNEDELTNGRRGPADWIAQAEDPDPASDGTDRDRSDSTYDDARDPFNNSRNTKGSNKLDYLIWQDSIAELQVSFIFNSSTAAGAGALPPEVEGFTSGGSLASSVASDHRPVIIDLILPPAPACCECQGDLDQSCDGYVDFTDYNIFATAYGSSTGDPDWNECADLDDSGTVDFTDFNLFAGAWGPCP